ncbi:hypothetical protein KIH74_05575 [Kineosporia sp. J2-2]|uniref:Uncharacterized protein n=1 Tax=Kineosporia corallincola TaxID=2835133 RepID=A0ABS5TC15_9ACTN|nr:hypothetical protein [Kineosporia corallincola]MBT0768383.1 hypothetical protein [Kineosporia corallincola]
MSETIADTAVDAGTTGTAVGTISAARPQDYEFATVRAPRRLEWVYRDAYRHLGWVLDAFDPDGNPAVAHAVVTLRFRRELGYPNPELMRELQRDCDQALAVIAARERVRTAMVHSSMVLSGIVGAALVAGGVLTAVDAGSAGVLTAVLLGALGVVTWLIGMLGRRHLGEIAATRFGLGIEDQYATVLRTGEQGARLLAGTRPEEIFTLGS